MLSITVLEDKKMRTVLRKVSDIFILGVQLALLFSSEFNVIQIITHMCFAHIRF